VNFWIIFEIPEEDLIYFCENCSPCMLRSVLDRKKKEDKRLSNSKIVDHIKEKFSGDLHVLFSNDDTDEVLLQARLVGENYARQDHEEKSALC